MLELATRCKSDRDVLCNTALHTLQVNTPHTAATGTKPLTASDAYSDSLTDTLLGSPANAVLNTSSPAITPSA